MPRAIAVTNSAKDAGPKDASPALGQGNPPSTVADFLSMLHAAGGAANSAHAMAVQNSVAPVPARSAITGASASSREVAPVSQLTDAQEEKSAPGGHRRIRQDGNTERALLDDMAMPWAASNIWATPAAVPGIGSPEAVWQSGDARIAAGTRQAPLSPGALWRPDPHPETATGTAEDQNPDGSPGTSPIGAQNAGLAPSPFESIRAIAPMPPNSMTHAVVPGDARLPTAAVPAGAEATGAVQLSTKAPWADEQAVAAALRAALPPDVSRTDQRDAAVWRPTMVSPAQDHEMASVTGQRARGDGQDASQGERRSSPNATQPWNAQAVLGLSHSTGPEAAFAGHLSSAHAVPASDRAELVSRIAASIEAIHASGGRQEVVLRLSPPHLGDVHIVVASDHSGLSAQITASTEAARALLEATRDELRVALEQKGFNVLGLGVAVQHHLGGGARDASPRPPSRGARTLAVEAADPITPDLADLVPVQVRVGRGGRLDARM